MQLLKAISCFIISFINSLLYPTTKGYFSTMCEQLVSLARTRTIYSMVNGAEITLTRKNAWISVFSLLSSTPKYLFLHRS